MLGIVARISKSSGPVKPRSRRRTPRYSPVGMRSWVLMSLRVVVSSSARRSARRRRFGSQLGQVGAGAREAVRQSDAPALGVADGPGDRAGEVQAERPGRDDRRRLDGPDVLDRVAAGSGRLAVDRAAVEPGRLVLADRDAGSAGAVRRPAGRPRPRR